MSTVFNKDTLSPETESYCKQLLDATGGAFSLLMNNPIINSRKPDADPSLREAVSSIDLIEQNLENFTASTIAIQPRTIRDKDVRKLSGGEHAGVTVEYTDVMGNIIRINFFNGLRDPKSHSDEHDRDIRLRNSHATRTLDVLSKPTHVNMQMQKRGSEELEFDTWFTASQTQLKLSSLIACGKTLDLVSTLNAPSNQGTPAGNTLHSMQDAIRFLVQVVDNPASPR